MYQDMVVAQNGLSYSSDFHPATKKTIQLYTISTNINVQHTVSTQISTLQCTLLSRDVQSPPYNTQLLSCNARSPPYTV